MPTPSITQCVEGINRANILLDTNFLIDSLRSINNNPEDSPYLEFITEIKEANNTLVSIPPVALEFLKGSNILSDRQVKKNFYDDLVAATLPLDNNVIENADLLTQLYRNKGKDISSTDFFVGGTAMKYFNSNFYLLTRDHDDFPVRIFDRERAIIFQHPKGGVDVYGLFKYSDKKGPGIQEELAKIAEKSA
jgi:predicted nucleic acid-binding protein